MTLQWALVGASDIAATRMLPALRQLGHDITAVYSGSAARADEFARTHDIARGTTSLDEALTDADAVYISSTNDKHAAQEIGRAHV